MSPVVRVRAESEPARVPLVTGEKAMGDESSPPPVGSRSASTFEDFYGRALRLTYLLVGATDEAEDVVAEVFARLFARPVVVPDDTWSYLRAAVVNEVRGRFRRRTIRTRYAERRRGDDRGVLGPAEVVVDRELLRGALAKLPASQRAVVVLRYYEDLSEADMAGILGIRIGTVKSRLSRALSTLRRQLDAPESTDA